MMNRRDVIADASSLTLATLLPDIAAHAKSPIDLGVDKGAAGIGLMRSGKFFAFCYTRDIAEFDSETEPATVFYLRAWGNEDARFDFFRNGRSANKPWWDNHGSAFDLVDVVKFTDPAGDGLGQWFQAMRRIPLGLWQSV